MTSLWARGRGWLVLALVVLVACGVAAAFALTQTEGERGHRDEALFLRQVKEYFDGDTHPEPEGVPDSVYIAEGDNACQWLATQPAVSGRAPDQAAHALFTRFVREVEPVEAWPFGKGRGVRGSVVYESWNYLCHDSYDTRIWQPPRGAD